MPKFEKNPSPFMLKSGNSPLYKELGGPTIFGKTIPEVKDLLTKHTSAGQLVKSFKSGIDWIKEKGKGGGASSGGSKTTPPKANIRMDERGNRLWHPPMSLKRSMKQSFTKRPK